MDTTYAHIMQLTLPSTDASYQLLDEDAAAALMEAANNAIAQMDLLVSLREPCGLLHG